MLSCFRDKVELLCLFINFLSFFIFIYLFIDMFVQCECVACLLNVSTAFCLLGVRTLPVLFKTQAFNFLTRSLPTFSSYTYVTVDGF